MPMDRIQEAIDIDKCNELLTKLMELTVSARELRGRWRLSHLPPFAAHTPPPSALPPLGSH